MAKRDGAHGDNDLQAVKPRHVQIKQQKARERERGAVVERRRSSEIVQDLLAIVNNPCRNVDLRAEESGFGQQGIVLVIITYEDWPLRWTAVVHSKRKRSKLRAQVRRGVKTYHELARPMQRSLGHESSTRF